MRDADLSQHVTLPRDKRDALLTPVTAVLALHLSLLSRPGVPSRQCHGVSPAPASGNGGTPILWRGLQFHPHGQPTVPIGFSLLGYYANRSLIGAVRRYHYSFICGRLRRVTATSGTVCDTWIFSYFISVLAVRSNTSTIPVQDMTGLGCHQRGTSTNSIAVVLLSSSPPLALLLRLRKFPIRRPNAYWNGVSSKPLSIASRANPLVSGWNAKHTVAFNKEHPPNKKYGPPSRAVQEQRR